jgi:hypothetical protein
MAAELIAPATGGFGCFLGDLCGCLLIISEATAGSDIALVKIPPAIGTNKKIIRDLGNKFTLTPESLYGILLH